MTQAHTSTEQPEALLVAKWLRESPEEAASWADVAAGHLENLHARVQELQSQLVTESARTANEKLRADQMTERLEMANRMGNEARALLASQAQRAPLSNQDAETFVRDCDYNPHLVLRTMERRFGITQEQG